MVNQFTNSRGNDMETTQLTEFDSLKNRIIELEKENDDLKRIMKTLMEGNENLNDYISRLLKINHTLKSYAIRFRDENTRLKGLLKYAEECCNLPRDNEFYKEDEKFRKILEQLNI